MRTSLAPMLLAILAAGCSSTEELAHADRGDLVSLIHKDNRRAECVAWSPDGTLLASGNRKAIKLWDGIDHDLVTTYPGPTWAGPQGLAFSRDGRLLASAGSATQLETLIDRTGIRVWDVHDEAARWRDPVELEGPHRGAGGLSFTPDGQKLVCGGYDGTIALWDLSKREKVWEVPRDDSVPEEERDDVLSVSVSADGKLVAATGIKSAVRILDAESGNLVRRVEVLNGRCVAFAPRGDELAIAEDSGLRIVRGSDSRVVLTRGKPLAVAWSSDEKKIAVANAAGGVEIYSAREGKRLELIRESEEPCVSVSFAPDGKHVAWASWDGKVRIRSVD